MAPSRFVTPPQWSHDELQAGRAEAQARFRQRRRDEGPRRFAEVYAGLEPLVRAALVATDDLRHISGDLLLTDQALWQLLRYVTGPPVSEEDLWTLVGGPKFKRVPPEWAQETAAAISDVLDPVRFPWVEAGRDPTAYERDAAVLATTELIAVRLVATTRRGEASTQQEAAVAAALVAAGLSLDASRVPVHVLDQLARGHYSRERKIAGAKCDVPARLHDGRLFAIECKVSNGPKNSWKRLNREVGGKAEHWRQQFGTQVVTAVVLGGVYDLSCLVTAQRDQGVVLFWEHDLAPLAEFARSTA